MRFRCAWLLAAIVVAGCTGDPVPPAPPATPSGITVPEATLESRAVDAAGDRLTMTMLPLIRSGSTVVLTIDTTLDSARTTMVTRHFSTILATSFDNVRLVDETGRRVYTVAPGAGGDGCVCTGLQRLETGETLPLQAAFTGVPETVTRMSVMLPYAGVFADVPIIPGTPSLPVQEAGPSLAAELDAYTERPDVALRTKRTPDRVEVSLDADVLFRLDSADLTPSAAKAVRAAVQDIQAGAPGPLAITGHTDDSGSAAHNQALSQARASTVSKALTGALPDAQWPKTIAGKGETEPSVPNSSAAGRRLNRRVTISFRRTTAKPPPVTAKTELPTTEGVRATALEGVEIALPLHRGTVRFTARPARIRGPFLQVDLVARSTGDDDATILDYLGQGIFTARDEFDPYAPYGASGVRMLDGATVAYGLDYVTAKGGHRCLCDRILNQAIPPGSEQVIALWFPAPPPGTTTVTLDVPDKFRLTDVPIT